MLDQLLLISGKLIRRNGGTKLALAPKPQKPDEPNTLRIRFSQNITDPTSITELGTWERVENSEFNDWDLTNNNFQPIISYDEQFEMLKSVFQSDDNIVFNRISDNNVTVTITPLSDFYDFTNESTISDLKSYGFILSTATGSFRIDDEENKIITVTFSNEPIHTLVYINSLDNLNDDFIILDGKIDNYIKFANTSRLTSIEKLNTSNVTNMNYMFRECTSLTNVPLFDTSNVINMDGMFWNCNKLTSVPLFDTSNVTNMGNMFRECSSLTNVPLFDTSNVTVMGGMLFECSSLTTVPLFNTSNVVKINDMFYGCSSLTSVPLFNTSNVIEMGEMFRKCTSLITVPLFDTSNVTDISGMFNGCTSLTTVPLFDTGSVNYMYQMFEHCHSLTTIPLFNTSNVTLMWNMFNECTSLTSVPLFNTSNVTDANQMLCNCTKIESGALALYNNLVASGKITNRGRTFLNCGKDTTTGLAELQQIPQSWGGLAAG